MPLLAKGKEDLHHLPLSHRSQLECLLAFLHPHAKTGSGPLHGKVKRSAASKAAAASAAAGTVTTQLLTILPSTFPCTLRKPPSMTPTATTEPI